MWSTLRPLTLHGALAAQRQHLSKQHQGGDHGSRFEVHRRLSIVAHERMWRVEIVGEVKSTVVGPARSIVLVIEQDQLLDF